MKKKFFSLNNFFSRDEKNEKNVNFFTFFIFFSICIVYCNSIFFRKSLKLSQKLPTSIIFDLWPLPSLLSKNCVQEVIFCDPPLIFYEGPQKWKSQFLQLYGLVIYQNEDLDFKNPKMNIRCEKNEKKAKKGQKKDQKSQNYTFLVFKWHIWH